MTVDYAEHLETRMQVMESNPVVNRPMLLKWCCASKLRSIGGSAAVAIVLFAAVVGLQGLAGAFAAEFGGYPDEASHYMSGLLVHGYVAAGFPTGPMKFAQNFYLHYPYFAIGHWPPLFYALEGVWMLLFSPARVSVLLLMASITVLLALATYRVVQREFGGISAWVIALLLVCHPLVQKYTSMVMLETLLALLSFWAVICFGRFLDSGRWQDSAKFAVFASLAILTKANGFELALVPLVAVLACRRLDLVPRPSFWLPAAVVALLCLPWHLTMMHLMLPTFTADWGLDFTTKAVAFYTRALVNTLGLGLLCLAALGVFGRAVKPLWANQVEGKWAAFAALPLGVIVLHSVVPGGLEQRYLVTAVAPVLLFCCAGADFLAERFSALGVRARPEVFLLCGALIFVKMSFAVPPKASFGFKEVADDIVANPQYRNSLILVSSETDVGEGIFVSEIAMRDHAFHHVVLRASKVLARNTWNQSLDKDYKPLYSNAEELRRCLKQAPISAIVIDSSSGSKTYRHHRQIVEMMELHPENWRLLGCFRGGAKPPGSQEGVQLYSLPKTCEKSPQGADPLSHVRTNLDSRLRNWPISIRFVCSPDVEWSRASASQ